VSVTIGWKARVKRTHKRKHIEDDHARALATWASHHRELRDIFFHIPNGGRRNPREAARLRGMGVRRGVSDYFLPLARGGYHGLFIELKPPNPISHRVTPEQTHWIALMTERGYLALVCFGWFDARDAILRYLALGSTCNDNYAFSKVSA
jgi:hypothetical protein